LQIPLEITNICSSRTFSTSNQEKTYTSTPLFILPMISFVENLSDSTKQLLLAVGAGLFIGAGFYIVWTTRSKTEALTNGTQKFEHQTAGLYSTFFGRVSDKSWKVMKEVCLKVEGIS
jgi:hypothetical protein